MSFEFKIKASPLNKKLEAKLEKLPSKIQNEVCKKIALTVAEEIKHRILQIMMEGGKTVGWTPLKKTSPPAKWRKRNVGRGDQILKDTMKMYKMVKVSSRFSVAGGVEVSVMAKDPKSIFHEKGRGRMHRPFVLPAVQETMDRIMNKSKLLDRLIKQVVNN